MKIVTKIDKMRTYARIMKKQNKLIGFIPTMGALHEGHLSLIRTARKQSDVVIVSVFVNPAQFGPDEDFARYPRDIKKDEELARVCGVDCLFYPEKEEMYPKGFATCVTVEGLTDVLCGGSRPGHFKGVTTIVTKLFEITKPDIAYFGQKDAQQAFVIKKMIEDLNMDVTLKILPVVREEDGLAMSSRNRSLSQNQQKEARVLYRALEHAHTLIQSGEREAEKIISGMRTIIKEAPSAKIDYVSIVDTEGLRDVKHVKGEVLIALAVWIGKTRLIDNIIVNLGQPLNENTYVLNAGRGL